MLTFSQADAILVEAFTPRLSPAGFTFVGKRTWTRAGKPHICELVRFYHTKGAGITPIWGVALDFVPEVTGSRLKWTRKPQDLYMDLEWFPLDYDEAYRVEAAAAWHRYRRLMSAGEAFLKPTPRKGPSLADRWYANILDSEEVFTKRAPALAELTAVEAVPFLDRIRDLNSVAGLLAFQSTYAYQGLGFFGHVQPPLAYAFLLARLGCVTEARSMYKSYCERITVREDVRPKLDAAFEDALASPFPTRL